MAATTITGGTNITPAGTENIPLGNGASKVRATTQAVADLARVSTLKGLGTGAATALAINVGSPGAFVIYSYAVPSGDQTNTTNVAANATGLSFPVLANSLYRFSGYLHTGCSTANGVKLAFTGPAGSSIYFDGLGSGASGSAFIRILTSTLASLTQAFNTVTSAFGGIRFDGTFTTVGTPGTIQVQFASATNGDTSTIFQVGSFIQLEKLA